MTSGLPLVHLGPLNRTTNRTEQARSEALTTAARTFAAQPAAHRAVIVGTEDPQFCALLGDVLRDEGIEVRRPDELQRTPEVVLAAVDRINGVRAITEARSRYKHAPLVALLPLGTHRLATRAIAAGAQSCYMLDMPIDRLRAQLRALLRDKTSRR
jgi:DNA-binding NarL/FixJ family response regulator